MYSILGCILFGDNDPAHFGTLGVAMISLFRGATLSAWYELLYINWYGCDKYSGGSYRLAPGLDPYGDDDAFLLMDDDSYAKPNTGPFMRDTGYGLFPDFICWKPTPKPVVSFFFFFSYTLISSFVILSLLVGVVTISMQATMAKIHKFNLRKLRDKKLFMKRQYHPIVYTRYLYGGKTGRDLQFDSNGLPITELLHPVIIKKHENLRGPARQNKKKILLTKIKHADMAEEVDFVFGEETPVRAVLKHLMKLSIRGRYEVDPQHMPGNLGEETEEQSIAIRMTKMIYLRFGTWCEWYVSTTLYSVLMIALIALFATLVGVETAYPDHEVIISLHYFCTATFMAECIVKLSSFKMRPKLYFLDPYNSMDFVIAVGGVLLAVTGSAYRGLALARLLRLIQVFKLANKLPRLQLVTESLIYGLRSMMWVALLFALFNYLFALLGIMLFKDNDPFYFGSILHAIGTLWNVETLNNWEHPMFVNVFGCDYYGYGELGKGARQGELSSVPATCTQPSAFGGVAVIYFCVVVAVGGLILPTLLTAVITAFTVHMGQNKQERSEHSEKLKKVVSIAPDYLTETRVSLLKELFANLDVTGDGSLKPEELLPSFTALSDDVLKNTNPSFIRKLFSMVDKSEDGNVDIAEFLAFFCRLASAMALRIGKPSNEFVEDPVVFEQQFVVLCLELARGADENGENSTATVIMQEQDMELEQQAQEINARDVAKLQRSGAVGAELMSDINTAGTSNGLGKSNFGVSHQPSSIFDIYHPEQLHKHIRWLASRLEAKSSEATAVKKELAKLKTLLGSYDHVSQDAISRGPPLPGIASTPDLHPEVSKARRVKKVHEEISKVAHSGYREQWEAKVIASQSVKGGMVSAAATAVLNGQGRLMKRMGEPLVDDVARTTNNSMDRDIHLLMTKNTTSGGGSFDHGSDVLNEQHQRSPSSSHLYDYDDGYAVGALISCNTAFLVDEWQGVFGVTAEAVAIREEELELRRQSAANPDHPVPTWVGRGGWASLAEHNRTNVNVTSLPDESRLASAMGPPTT
mmetsp:Transcript_48720/g.62541  ORF Transcript_48720/g.62541 Transcript_48720/m.62541 type:complete len:1036 (-) Transcript_48720:292-3399(-)